MSCRGIRGSHGGPAVRPRAARGWCWLLGLLSLAQPAHAQGDPKTPPVTAASAAADPGDVAPATPRPEQSSQPEPSAPSDPDELRYVLDGIEVRGNTKTRAHVVLRYVPFQPGDVLDVDDPNVQLTRYRLLGTGFFRDVQFSLKKGRRRGHVVLVIEVVERNTIIINDLWMGLSADADGSGRKRPLTPFAGLDAAETNLAGTGISLGSAVGLAQDQLALRVRFFDPAVLGGPWMTSGEILFNSARDFFGNDNVLWDDPSQLSGVPRHAVISYKRFGGSVAGGHDLSVASQVWLRYRLEGIDVTSIPRAASHEYGGETEPIDFKILPGQSLLSTLRASFQHDTRDQPVLPSRGWFTNVATEMALAPFGSDYAYQKLEVASSHWWPLSWGHVLSLNLFAGGIAGTAPFFEQYYVGDLSDFRPGRALGLNFDRRPAPDFLGTAVSEVRYAEYAAKLTGEYRIPLYRGQRSIFGIDLFASAGAYAIAGLRDIRRPPRNYSGAARIPIDLTGNLGFRMDTSVGGFAFAFSNVLGFIPVRSEGN